MLVRGHPFDLLSGIGRSTGAFVEEADYVQAVKYARAESVEEAVSLLQDGGAGARPLAGGTDVIVQARERTRDIDLFVDIKHISEVVAIEHGGDGSLTIGAATPCYEIYGDDSIAENFPILVDSTSLIGGTAIQGRASLGGNLCNSSPAADGIPSLVVLEAQVEIAGPNGRRTVAVEDFCTGPGQNVLGSGEFVVKLHFPAPAEGSGARFLRFIPRNEMDIAVANAATQLRLDRDGNVSWARVSVGAVAPTPLLVADAAAAIVGQPLSEETIAAAAAASSAAATPITDMRGNIRQRVHLAGVLTERTIRQAAERAA